MSNQSVIKCSKILHDESKQFFGPAEKGFPYSSLRNINDDALRAYLKDLKKQYPKFAKPKEEKKK